MTSAQTGKKSEETPLPSTPLPTKRNEVFLEYTKSICPICKDVLDAETFAQDNQIFLRKRCPEHGEFTARTYGDAEAYFATMRYNKPGTFSRETQTEVKDGCPLDCGLCPEHKQHACLGLIEVNSNCNLDCPVCFADSGTHQPNSFSLTHAQIEKMLDTFVAAEGEPEVVMFSGGEPSIHPHILDFIALAQEKGVKRVVLNTNGIKLAHDKGFARALGELQPAIYLQFDGFDEATHLTLRGRDLRKAKQAALDNCAENNLWVSLTATIEKAVNEHEVGKIIEFGMSHPAARAAIFQPTTHAGRMIGFDPTTRLTNPDIVAYICEQLPAWFRKSDFFPSPCCFPTCRTITYTVGNGKTCIPVPRLIEIDDYLDYITDRVLPDPDDLRGALEDLWSASAIPGTAITDEHISYLEDCAACGITTPAILDDLADQVFMIVIQDFQDPYTLNVRQLMKCCVEHITPDGRLIPFCAYNSVGYREQVREQLTGEPMPSLIPNADEPAPLLTPTPYGSQTATPATVHLTQARAKKDHTTARNRTNTGKNLR